MAVMGCASMAQVRPTPDRSAQDRYEKLEGYLRSARNAYKLNGCVLVADGSMVLQYAMGLKDAGTSEPLRPDTRFPILSITKTMTATAVLKLQEERKLSVRDRLSKYFADFPNGNKITLHHLLTHTSGIHNYSDYVGIEDSMITYYPMAKERILNQITSQPPDFPPGKGYSYNNSGYYLLGLIIEKVTGKPYESVIREMIFQPLNMHDSGFDFIHLPDLMKAKGYQVFDAKEVVPYKPFDSTYAYAAGSVYSTIGDLYKWARAISSAQILSGKSWELAFTPKTNGYGYGWMTGQFFGNRYVRHSGGYPGYMSELIYYPDKDITIIILNNFGNYDESLWPVVMGLSCILFDRPYDDWKLRKEIQVDATALARYAGIYRLDKRRNINIRLDGDHLVTEIPGLAPMKLYPEGEDVFFLNNFNTEYRFLSDSNGRVSELVIHEHGEDHKLSRLK
jgi:CubicO group peptidase (beta-lactamase class C family)